MLFTFGAPAHILENGRKMTMKKTLSMLIAVLMLVSVFSGTVLFTGVAKEAATKSVNYEYVQLNGVQNWTASDVSSLTTFGASFACLIEFFCCLIPNGTSKICITSAKRRSAKR